MYVGGPNYGTHRKHAASSILYNYSQVKADMCLHNLKHIYAIIIIIIIIIYCNWVVSRWQWLVYMYKKYAIGY